MLQLDRSKGIGCSDLPVIMGVSPYKTPYELWKEKITGLDLTIDNWAMKKGREMEPIIRKMAEEGTGLSLEPIQLFHPQKQWFWASLDGYDKHKRIASEFKTVGKDDHLTALSGKIPEKYYPQVQGQIEIADPESLWYFSYFEGHLQKVDVDYDVEYCKMMLEKVDEFWELVKTGKPPSLTEKDRVNMENNEEYLKTEDELWIVRENIKALEERDKNLSAYLIQQSQGRNCYGKKLSVNHSDTKGLIDWKRFQEDYPNLPFEAYRKPNSIKSSVRAI